VFVHTKNLRTEKRPTLCVGRWFSSPVAELYSYSSSPVLICRQRSYAMICRVARYSNM
jgi:hypothetical protein